MIQEPNRNAITVTDIDIPFGRLVTIMVKLMLASIPALLLFYIICFTIAAMFMIIFGGSAVLLQHMSGH